MFFEALISIFLILVGFALHGWSDARKEDRSFNSYFDALGMEIRRCGQLAATYLDEAYNAPLYRLPSDAYRRALPVLFRAGLVGGDQANKLQEFYWQVEQVNRGLDNVDDFLRGKTPENDGQSITVAREKERLEIMARDLRASSPGGAASDLYNSAVDAFTHISTAWLNRTWWQRIRKTRLRPATHRIKRLLSRGDD